MDYTLSISGSILSIIPSGELDYNTQYTVTIGAGVSGDISSTEWGALSSDYSFWFTSQYCPLFTTLGRVKLEVGPTANSFSDDSIYRLIYKNSIEAVDIYNISHSTNLPYNYWGCTYTNVPFHLSRYVLCKTAYDILNIAKISGIDGGSGGNQLKTLGDMTIKYGGPSAAEAASDPKKIKDLYACWQEALRMVRNVKVAVKGYLDTSKGYAHPVHEFHHNRVIRAVSFNNAQPRGPWENHTPWNGYKWR